MKNSRTWLKCIVAGALLGLAMTASADYSVSEEARARIEPVLKKSGGELTYFDGPGEMIGIGVSFVNGRQMVVYATPDGKTVFSGVAIDVASGTNLANADLQKLPPPNYEGLLQMVANSQESTGRPLSMISEGDPASSNRYYVFVDPKCPYCHKVYSAFLKLLAEDNDLVVYYIPIGILGPESENLAKEIIGLPAKEGLGVMRRLTQKEPYLTNPDNVSAGSGGHSSNLALFRQLQFDAVPVIISDVSGNFSVRRGAVSAEALGQELRIAKVEKLASAR